MFVIFSVSFLFIYIRVIGTLFRAENNCSFKSVHKYSIIGTVIIISNTFRFIQNRLFYSSLPSTLWGKRGWVFFLFYSILKVVDVFLRIELFPNLCLYSLDLHPWYYSQESSLFYINRNLLQIHKNTQNDRQGQSPDGTPQDLLQPNLPHLPDNNWVSNQI